jgi:hypothetical protein
VTEINQTLLKCSLRVNSAVQIGGDILTIIQDMPQRVFNFRCAERAVHEPPYQNPNFQSLKAIQSRFHECQVGRKAH